MAGAVVTAPEVADGVGVRVPERRVSEVTERVSGARDDAEAAADADGEAEAEDDGDAAMADRC